MLHQNDDIRVLVIDDVLGHRLLCQLAVDAAPGMQLVGEAVNGAEGAEQAEALQPDVIILDARMPVLDGFEALPLIRALAPSAQVLVWTACNEFETHARMLALGAAAVLPKTAGAEELVAAIRAACEPARERRERVAALIQPNRRSRHHAATPVTTTRRFVRGSSETLA